MFSRLAFRSPLFGARFRKARKDNDNVPFNRVLRS